MEGIVKLKRIRFKDLENPQLAHTANNWEGVFRRENKGVAWLSVGKKFMGLYPRNPSNLL